MNSIIDDYKLIYLNINNACGTEKIIIDKAIPSTESCITKTAIATIDKEFAVNFVSTQKELASELRHALLEVLKEIEYIDLVEGTSDLDLLLWVATLQGDVETVEFLLSNGANVHAVTRYNDTLLNLAIREGHVEITKKLIEWKIDIHTINSRGESALFSTIILAKQPKLAIIQSLVEAGADVNSYGGNGYSFLVKCITSAPTIEGGRVATVQYLLEKGADPQAITDDGFPVPVLYCTICATEEVGKDRGMQASIVELLLQHGANPNKSHVSLLAYTIKNRYDAVTKLLLEYGINPNPHDISGACLIEWTLQSAANLKTSDWETAKALLLSGALPAKYQLVKLMQLAEQNKEALLLRLLADYTQTLGKVKPEFQPFHMAINYGCDGRINWKQIERLIRCGLTPSSKQTGFLLANARFENGLLNPQRIDGLLRCGMVPTQRQCQSLFSEAIKLNDLHTAELLVHNASFKDSDYILELLECLNRSNHFITEWKKFASHSKETANTCEPFSPRKHALSQRVNYFHCLQELKTMLFLTGKVTIDDSILEKLFDNFQKMHARLVDKRSVLEKSHYDAFTDELNQWMEKKYIFKKTSQKLVSKVRCWLDTTQSEIDILTTHVLKLSLKDKK